MPHRAHVHHPPKGPVLRSGKGKASAKTAGKDSSPVEPPVALCERVKGIHPDDHDWEFMKGKGKRQLWYRRVSGIHYEVMFQKDGPKAMMPWADIAHYLEGEAHTVVEGSEQDLRATVVNRA